MSSDCHDFDCDCPGKLRRERDAARADTRHSSQELARLRLLADAVDAYVARIGLPAINHWRTDLRVAFREMRHHLIAFQTEQIERGLREPLEPR